MPFKKIYDDGLTRTQRYYRRHKEEILRKQKEMLKTSKGDNRRAINKKAYYAKKARDPDYFRNKAKHYYHKFRERLLKTVGDKCGICDRKESLLFHEINGVNHTCKGIRSPREIYNKLENYQFVTLCRRCHSYVHWSMRILDMTWVDIKRKRDRMIQKNKSLLD